MFTRFRIRLYLHVPKTLSHCVLWASAAAHLVRSVLLWFCVYLHRPNPRVDDTGLDGWLGLGFRVLFWGLLLKADSRKKGTLIIKGLLRSLVYDTGLDGWFGFSSEWWEQPGHAE